MKFFSLQVVFAAIFAALAAAAIISFFVITGPIRIVVVGAFAMVAVLYLSGNPRLLCLWGLVLSTPLNLGKDFMIVPHMGGASSYSIDLVDVFLLPLIYFIARDFYWGRRYKIRVSWVSAYWLALISMGLMTMALGPFRNIAGHEILRTLKYLVLFWVIINEVVRVRQFIHVVGALALGVAIQSIIAMAQFFLKRPIGLEILGEPTLETLKNVSQGTYLGAGGTYRVGALLGHPNLLSAYLALLLPVLMVFLFTRIRPAHKIGIGIATGLGLVALVLTLSRTGWIAFAVAFVTMMTLSFVHPRFRKRYLMTRVAVIGVVAIVALAFSGEIIKRVTQSDTGAVSFRREWMQVSWNMIQDRPVIGFGLNSFTFNMPTYTRYGGPLGITEKFGENWPVVHNIYLLTWVEQGTIGLLFFVGFHIHMIWIGMRNLKFFENEILFSLSIGCISGFLAMMVDGLASFYIRNPCGRVFWVVAALIVAVHFWNRENRQISNATSVEEKYPELA